ncbi:prolipoprotein diacylglyceryl transferase [Psychrobacter phenylpyruvicus]|uniref:Phosphatidylglycerol--prolipoprotein diacylglyceryl transferase n=1 Tax=Psychrobacter phenylpyruvicus TaxID=29432 RepID=A0A379LR06_9GAMM|nr:prolipoprotein diacylglyceryl transferase [Psychrobacter phenylpyruvicus]SUD89720.1 Prolipoprotein diacylglyceryl transferase [Psychrobacter phenylpyruvicus]SUD92164.1 Prolipoprotein diacylglyceryl transferase [Psychrobacter phenylpyruvicus]
MMIHPQFDPVAFSLGPLQVHWYGFMYLLAFVAAYGLAWYRSTKREGWSTEMVSDLVFFGALGVILGGRIGYVLLYQFSELLQNPMYLFRVWEGGMSFHGGFIGVALAMVYFAKKYKKPIFNVLDFIVPCVPTGLLFGRIGNYINGELWGRVSDGGYNWLTYFPQAVNFDAALIATNPALQSLMTDVNGNYLLPRHPSQLYEALAEGLLTFILVWWFSSKPRPRMAVTALFMLCYGFSRFTIEFFRQPDEGYALIFGWMSKGQLYTLPMIIIGIVLMVLAYRRQQYDWGKYATHS